jgi:23S rRNA (adenine2503-C2)-methyltransferase
MLKGVNDSPMQARQLVQLLRSKIVGNSYSPHLVHVNLMRFNEWEGSVYESCAEEVIDRFAEILRDGRIPTTVRKSKGNDIYAACGQLKSSAEVKAKFI